MGHTAVHAFIKEYKRRFNVYWFEPAHVYYLLALNEYSKATGGIYSPMPFLEYLQAIGHPVDNYGKFRKMNERMLKYGFVGVVQRGHRFKNSIYSVEEPTLNAVKRVSWFMSVQAKVRKTYLRDIRQGKKRF